MKKKIIGIIIGIVVLILILLGFFAYKEMNDYTNIIRLNRGIEIPKEANVKELYSKDRGESFHGDGIRYHVFSYEKEEVVESMLDWEKPDNEVIISPTIYYDSYMETITNWLVELDIDDEYSIGITDFESVYYENKEDNSEIIIVKSSELKRLYIIESFL